MTKAEKKNLKNNIKELESRIIDFFKDSPFVSFVIKRNNVKDNFFYFSINNAECPCVWFSMGNRSLVTNDEKTEFIKRKLGENYKSFLIQANLKEIDLVVFYDKIFQQFHSIVYWHQRLVYSETFFENGKLTINC